MIELLRELAGVHGQQQERDHHDGDDERDARHHERHHEGVAGLGGEPPLEEAHRDERDEAREQGGHESEPEQLDGLHEVAAGGTLLGHRAPPGCGSTDGGPAGDGSAGDGSGTPETGAPAASDAGISGRRGENPAMPRYTATMAA